MSTGTATITLKCGACGNLMGVGSEFAGRPVRCPHCKRVVQVPGAPAVPVVAQAPVSAPDNGVSLPPADAPSDLGAQPFTDSFTDSLTDGASASSSPVFADDLKPTLVPAAGPMNAAPTVFLESKPRPAPLAIGDRPRRKLPLASWFLIILIPYAIASSTAAVLLYQRATKIQTPINPLESLGDQGLYEEMAEGKVKMIPDPLHALPEGLEPVKLKERRQFGDLEVTPLEVTRQKLNYTFFHGAENYQANGESLVLRLRLRNISDKLVFHPNDPTFNQALRLEKGKPEQRPFNYLVIDDKRYYGPVKNVLYERVQGQNFGELVPGASLETIVATSDEGPNPGEPSAVKALDALVAAGKGSEPLLWRVHLRKGRLEVITQSRSRPSVWVTTVVPVTFTAADVKKIADDKKAK